jgi:hypothetical protein
MPRGLPTQCFRKRLDCNPLHAVASDDEVTFICCGLIHESARNAHDDYRLCCKGQDGIDSIHDIDELDMLDQIEVLSRGLTSRRRLTDVH